tara:strand:+ start:106 stop:555 length:450 start_codon:yes stop_codon:yes gene_type:complete
MKSISYDDYLELRDDEDLVVLDAYEIEPFLHVGPKSSRASITQEILNEIISGIIPTQDTKIILYCWQNFMPTRTMPARSIVGVTLAHMGYKNVYLMDDLWHEKGEDFAKTAFENEIAPYKVPLSQSAMDALEQLKMKNDKNAVKAGDIE